MNTYDLIKKVQWDEHCSQTADDIRAKRKPPPEKPYYPIEPVMKYKYNDTVFLIGYGPVKIIAVNTNESYSNLTTYDLKDVLEDGLNTFYSVCAERIERVQDDQFNA